MIVPDSVMSSPTVIDQSKVPVGRRHSVPPAKVVIDFGTSRSTLEYVCFAVESAGRYVKLSAEIAMLTGEEDVITLPVTVELQ